MLSAHTFEAATGGDLLAQAIEINFCCFQLVRSGFGETLCARVRQRGWGGLLMLINPKLARQLI